MPIENRKTGMETKQETPNKWLFDSRRNIKHSPWLQSTLAELDMKTKQMLKLIEVDRDSFAEHAELYYKKRPELISLVEDFYRAHRSLAEKYDQVKFDSGTHKRRLEKITSLPVYLYDNNSTTSDSEIEDVGHEDATQVAKHTKEQETIGEVRDHIVTETKEEIVTSGIEDDNVIKLREEVQRLKRENMVQKEELIQKDEEKREAIRHLSVAVMMLKEDNTRLKEVIKRNSKDASR